MDLSLTILGSSSALPLSNRYPSAQYLSISDRHFLIDCGEGTQMQLRRNRIGFSRINHIMISHLHGDHIYGLLPLLTTMHLLDRHKELHIYAPVELEENIEQNLRLSHSKLRFEIVFHSLNMQERELIFEDQRLKVTSIPLKHSLPCCGFLFEEKQRPRKVLKNKLSEYGINGPEVRKIQQGEDWESTAGERIANHELTADPLPPLSYAYCSDTAPVAGLADLLQTKPDLIYHEATFMDEHSARARQTKHSTARQAGEAAQRVGARYLLVGHFSTRYDNLELLLEEAKQEFEQTYLALENWTYVLKSGKKLVAEYKVE